MIIESYVESFLEELFLLSMKTFLRKNLSPDSQKYPSLMKLSSQVLENIMFQTWALNTEHDSLFSKSLLFVFHK